MRGISHLITIYSSKPSAEQMAVYSVLIRSLRDLKYEYVIFEFENCDETEGADELAFCQICVDHDHIMRIEFRTGPHDDWRLYSKTCSREEAVGLFAEMCETRKAPSKEGWEDISESVKNGTAG